MSSHARQLHTAVLLVACMLVASAAEAQVLEVSIASPTDGSVVTTATPIVSGTATAGATVEVAADGDVVGSATADGSGVWSFALTTALAEGERTVTATVTTIDASVMDAATFTIDTLTSVAITTPASGSTIGGTLTEITGTGEPDAMVSVSLDTVLLGDVAVDQNGDWTFALTSSLGVGSYVVEVSALDTQGHTATDSSAFSVVFCVTASDCLDGDECTREECVVGSCSSIARGLGASCSAGVCDANGDCAAVALSIVAPADGFVTGDPTPTVSGTATPGVSVSLTVDGAPVGSAVADSLGTWMYVLTAPLLTGVHVIVAQVTTSNGDATGSVTFAVDRLTEVTIASPTDSETLLDATPTVSGTGEPGADVVITIDGDDVGSAVVAVTGIWQLTVASALTNGAHVIVARATDRFGNTGDASVSFSVDANTQVAITSPVEGSFIVDPQPIVRGTAAPGATLVVTLDDGANVITLGALTVDGNAQWAIATTNPLGFGTYTVTARATDVVGNMAEDSVTFTLVMEASPDSDAGFDDDAGAESDAAVDAGLIADAAVGEDAGADASVLVDASVDAGAQVDGSVIADAGGDSGMNMGDGSIDVSDAGGRRKGRYAGGALCSASTGTSSSHPFALIVLTLVVTALASRARRRRS